MHLRFMNYCNSNIFPTLNGDCSHNLTAVLPYPENRLHGKDEMLSNTLPSFLLIGERFLIIIDFDRNTENEVLDLIEQKLNSARTKGTTRGHQSRIKIIERNGNFFRVMVAGKQKLIVVLPLGLLNLYPQFFSTHTVEDYIFEQIDDKSKLSSNTTSKEIINEMDLSRCEINNHLKAGITRHKHEIIEHLEPLWEN